MLTYCRYLNIFICTVVCWPCGDQEPAPVGGEVRWNVPPLVHRLTNSKQQNYKTIFLTRWLSSTPRQAIHVLFRVFPIIPSPEPEIIGFWAAVPDCSVLVDSMPPLLSFSTDWGQMAAVRSFRLKHWDMSSHARHQENLISLQFSAELNHPIRSVQGLCWKWRPVAVWGWCKVLGISSNSV